MTLMSVDLPEPEGPHTTTTSPFSIFVLQVLSTCTSPYHLETSFNSIIGFSPFGFQRMMAIRLFSRLTM